MERLSENDAARPTTQHQLMDRIRQMGVAPRILKAIERVPREAFVPESLRSAACSDDALPIGHAQTISQPSLVALMTDALEVGADDVVLEVGTGSGYQAAILANLHARRSRAKPTAR